jgi:undecaprenyl pyrophosphate phosphatase UppP
MPFEYKDLTNYGDIVAIPLFLIAIVYFRKKENRTLIENLLLLFMCIGLVFDTISTYFFLQRIL